MHTMLRLKLVIALRAVMSFSMMTTAVAQDGALPNYAPLLPQAKERAWAVDPQKGYVVRELKPNVYLITNGGYQALFITTGSGVTLFDAPPSFASHIDQAVADVTSERIVRLVYSHMHVDHISGAGLLLRQNPNMEIVAEDGDARFLREQKDPSRPEPTNVFKDHEKLTCALPSQRQMFRPAIKYRSPILSPTPIPSTMSHPGSRASRSRQIIFWQAAACLPVSR
jgi:glyoxylase-like metal-dependent hydrolase (beta-lactamase superfamily II)